MADFNRHLKKNKILVFLTIFAFLYMSCFTSCSNSGRQEKAEVAKKADHAVEAAETKDGKQAIAESQSSEKSEKEEEPSANTPGVSGSADNAGQKRPLTQEELNQKAEILDRYFQALEELNRDIPRDSFDPQAIVDKVGKDPEMLFKWVRDNTYLVPYQGVLRGPIGVLMDRLGNSLDRAMLLYELLRLAGHQVRLARGDLSNDQAKEIIQEARPISLYDSFSDQKFRSQELDDLIQKCAAKYHLEQAELNNNISNMLEGQKDFSIKIDERVKEQTAVILDAIKDLRKTNDDENKNEKNKIPQDHWWVQISKDDGWVDLDPTFAGATFARILTKAKETLGPGELDQNLFHLVKIRAIIEQWSEKKLQENVVLEYTLKPSSLFDKRIVLTHIPMNWPQNIDFFQEGDPINVLNSKVQNEKEWLPILMVGSEKVIQSSFTDSGEVNRNPGKKRKSGGVSGITGGIFGALGGQESAKEEDKESYLTAEWIEYEILSPGNPSSKIRRQIFDLIGPAARLAKNNMAPDIAPTQRIERGLALIGETEILIQVCKLSPYFVSRLIVQSLLANREILQLPIREDDSLKSKNLFDTLKKVTPLPGPQYVLAIVRDEWSKIRDQWYLSSPNILNYFKGIRQISEGKTIRYAGFDIVFNGVAVPFKSGANSFQIRLEQGIVDTNAEALVMDNAGEATENTSEIFGQTIRQGLEWLIIKDLSDPALRQLKIANDARVRVEQDLAEGNIVIIPKENIDIKGRAVLAWWRINSKTGQTLGIGQNGFGQDFVEYVLGEVAVVIPGIICLFSSKEVKEPCRWHSAINCWAGLGEGGVVGSIIYFLGPSRIGFAFVIALAAISFAIAENYRRGADCR